MRIKGIKQEFMADRLNINQSNFSQKLSLGNNIKYSFLLDISNILEMSVVEIISFPKKIIVSEDCVFCREKEETIRNLNEYINLLKNK
jgi:transcriptional regulator with XRE-family HTH domain